MTWTPESSEDLFSRRELAGLCLLLVVLFGWTLAPLAGYDFWYYLALGRQVVETGKIPWSETYLGTTSTLGLGRYADYAWLGNSLCYLAFAAAGPLGLVLLKSSLLTATTGLTYCGCRISGLAPFWAGAWSTLALWTIRGRFEMRTYLFTDLALAALTSLLILSERKPRPYRDAACIYLLFTLWTNLHQGVIAGYLVMGCWLVLGRQCWKQRALLTALAVGGSLTKPNAIHFPASIYEHFANTSAIEGVVEWSPPSWSTIIKHLGPFYLVIGWAIAVTVIRGRKQPFPPWAFAATALCFSYLALRSNRSISELLPVACPLVAAYMPRMPERARAKLPAALLLAGALWWTFPVGPPGALNSVTGYPEKLVDALPKEGQVFNSFEFGNYLVYRNVAPFLHGMTSLYQEQLVKDFQAVLNPTPRRAEILQKFQVSSALLHFPTDNDATLNLVETLAGSPDWKLELWDDTGLLFVRGNRGLGLTQVQPWRSPAWRDAEAAERELLALIRRQPSALAHFLLSRLMLERGDLAAATEQASQAVAVLPSFYPGWSQLGLCYARAGNLEGVLTAARGGMKAPGGGAPALFNRGLSLFELSKRESGLQGWLHRLQARYYTRRSLWLDPSFEPARKLEQSF
jgi:tetratricopeptide (TPR) repeat protein